jgi:hypothetical protein
MSMQTLKLPHFINGEFVERGQREPVSNQHSSSDVSAETHIN